MKSYKDGKRYKTYAAYPKQGMITFKNAAQLSEVVTNMDCVIEIQKITVNKEGGNLNV